jgi:hypothetical protein
MGSKDDYAKQEVGVCFSVLIELMTILGEFRENIVLTGGWIPYFVLPDNHEHVGSLDIDIALDFQKISEDTYRTMLQTLESKGYRRGHQPFIFFRDIVSRSSTKITVEIDLLAGEYRRVQDSCNNTLKPIIITALQPMVRNWRNSQPEMGAGRS